MKNNYFSVSMIAGLLLLLAVPAGADLVATPLTGSEPNTVLLYKFDEFTGHNVVVSGGALEDSSPNGLDGAFTTTRVFTSDLATGFGNAMRLSTSGVRLAGGNLSAAFFEGDFTIEAWFRLDGLAKTSGNVGQLNNSFRFFTSRTGGGTIGWLFELTASGTSNKLQVHNGSAWSDAITDILLPTSGWAHLAMVFENTNPGNTDSSYSVSFYLTDPASHTEPNLLGTFALNPNQNTTSLAGLDLSFLPLVGSTDTAWIDELRLSNAATTDFYALGAPVPEPATMAFLALGGLAMAGAAVRRARRRAV